MRGSGEHLQGWQGGPGDLGRRGAPVLGKWAAPVCAGPGAAPGPAKVNPRAGSAARPA